MGLRELPIEVLEVLINKGFAGRRVRVPRVPIPGRGWDMRVWEELTKRGYAGKVVYVPKRIFYKIGEKARAMELKKRGWSLRRIARLISQEEGREISYETIIGVVILIIGKSQSLFLQGKVSEKRGVRREQITL